MDTGILSEEARNTIFRFPFLIGIRSKFLGAFIRAGAFIRNNAVCLRHNYNNDVVK